MNGADAAPKVLLVQPAEPEPVIRDRHGEYADWFKNSPEVDPTCLHVSRPYTGEPLPDLAAWDAVIVTGARGSVYEPEAWLTPFGERLRAHVQSGALVLGVCYGHQLLGQLFGGRVIANPAGREIGTVRVVLSASGRKDPLFGQLPAGFTVNATHRDIVVDLPWQIPVLAGNGNTAVQAARFGPRAWGAQFHPELSGTVLRALIRSREAALREEGLDADALAAAVQEAPRGQTILPRFLALAAESKRASFPRS